MSQNNLEQIKQYLSYSQELVSEQLLKHPLLQRDIWHTVNDLSLVVNEHARDLTLNFSQISPEWFKQLVKLSFLAKARPNSKATTAVIRLVHLRKFSRFLTEQNIDNPNQINNQTFEAFHYYLRAAGISLRTIQAHNSSLCQFFNVCRLEGWLDINTYWFRGKNSGRCYPNNNEIEYLPEEIWNQLDANLHLFPEPLQRMVLIIRSTGIRVGELCNMPFNCLKKQGNQWRIRFKSEKYDVEDEMPIVVPELVVVIKEQQVYIRQQLGTEYEKLFCANKPGSKGITRSADGVIDEMLFEPKTKIMDYSSFNNWLNRLARKCNICTRDGKLWHFQSHQFRRTVATVMANAGVRDLIIQKYLRHRSPNMQNYYVHVLKKVLGDELEELMRENKYVDISGKLVASYKPENPITELLRRKMYQITTQYGECHRPILKAPCQTVNACWRCQEWYTSLDDLPELKKDLNRVEDELKIAKQMGMIRQQRGLEGDWHNLVQRIRGLEDIND